MRRRVPLGLADVEVGDPPHVLADPAVAAAAGALRCEQQVAGPADAQQPVLAHVGDVPVPLADVDRAELAALDLRLGRRLGSGDALQRGQTAHALTFRGSDTFHAPCSGSRGSGARGVASASRARPARRTS